MPISNTPYNENNKIYPPRLNMEMSDKDFEILKREVKQGNLNAFIESYKIDHPELSDTDIISLALMRAVGTREFSLSDEILNVLYEKDITSPYPLVMLDKNGNNTILYALEKGTCVTSLSGYIFGLIEENKIEEKFILEEELRNKIAHAIRYPKFSTHHEIIIKKLIEPIYTAESVEDLIETIGRNWYENALMLD